MNALGLVSYLGIEYDDIHHGLSLTRSRPTRLAMEFNREPWGV